MLVGVSNHKRDVRLPRVTKSVVASECDEHSIALDDECDTIPAVHTRQALNFLGTKYGVTREVTGEMGST